MAFTWASIGHFFASGATKVEAFFTGLKKIEPAIETGINTAVGIAAIIDPALSGLAMSLPQLEKAVMGEIYKVADATVSATGQPFNLVIDAELADAIRSAIPALKEAFAMVGHPTNPPASLK